MQRKSWWRLKAASRTSWPKKQLPPWSEARVVEAAREAATKGLSMPKRLSPSAVSCFLECEQLFLFRYLWKLPEPPSAVMLRGSLVHKVLEGTYKEGTSAEEARERFRDLWRRERAETRASLFGDSGDESRRAERDWGLEALRMIDAYYHLEDPQSVDVFDVERWLEETTIEGTSPPLKVVGKTDRLDNVDPTHLRVVDYKTGEAPSAKPYSRAFIETLQEQAFFQLKLYAYLLDDAFRGERRVSTMRLVYLGGDGAVDDRDVVPQDLDDVKEKLVQVWQSIYEKVQTQDPQRAFTHCDRSFCYCHTCRPLVFPTEGATHLLEDDHDDDTPLADHEPVGGATTHLVVEEATKQQQQQLENDHALSFTPTTNSQPTTTAPFEKKGKDKRKLVPSELFSPPRAAPETNLDQQTTTIPSKKNLDTYKVAELRAMCKERQIDSKVKRGDPIKDTLIARLRRDAGS